MAAALQVVVCVWGCGEGGRGQSAPHDETDHAGDNERQHNPPSNLIRTAPATTMLVKNVLIRVRFEGPRLNVTDNM